MNYNGKKDLPENEKMAKAWNSENSTNNVDIVMNKVYPFLEHSWF